MKTINFKPEQESINRCPHCGTGVGGQKQFTYEVLLLGCLKHAPKEGFTVTEMSTRMNIVNKIQNKDLKSLELEDAEFNKLKTCFNEMKWAVMETNIMLLDEAIKEAESPVLKAVKK